MSIIPGAKMVKVFQGRPSSGIYSVVDASLERIEHDKQQTTWLSFISVQFIPKKNELIFFIHSKRFGCKHISLEI